MKGAKNMMVFCAQCKKPFPSEKDYNEFITTGAPIDFICADCTGTGKELHIYKTEKQAVENAVKLLKALYEEVNSGNAEDDETTRWPEVRDFIKRHEPKESDPVIRRGMTKADVVKMLGLDQFTLDYALPQPWLDEAERFLKVTYPEDYSKPGKRPYEVLISGLVWLYDKHGQYTGRPYPLTRDATEALKRLPIRLSQLGPKALERGQLEIPKPEPKE